MRILQFNVVMYVSKSQSTESEIIESMPVHSFSFSPLFQNQDEKNVIIIMLNNNNSSDVREGVHEKCTCTCTCM